MHISHSETAPCHPEVQVGEPRQSPDGTTVFPPDVQVWPLGFGTPDTMRHYWSMTADEAELLAVKLYEGAQRSRELFPST